MKHTSVRSGRMILAAVALMCAGAIGCHDESTAPAMVPTPLGPMHNLGTTIFDVDMRTGRVTARSVAGSAPAVSGVSARFFGTSDQIEYNFFGTPQGFPSTGVVNFNLHGNISSKLPFAIGTNSRYTSPNYPQDTMGIYVYYTFLPYNIRQGVILCPACTVTVDSADGQYPFTTSQPQLYQYWKTILDSGGLNAQGPGRFETNQSGIGGINYFRRFSFRTTGGVSTFSFGVAMAAPWEEPNENRFKVHYVADSLPNRLSLDDLRSEPDWRVLGDATKGAVSSGALTLTTTVNDSIIYYRSDSLRQNQNGYITASLQSTAATGTEPGIFLGLKDPVKLAELGISTVLTGFTDSTGAFIPGFTAASVTSPASYRITKYGTDSASIFSPAGSTTALVTIPYASLPPAPVRGSGPPNYDRFFFFGNMTASLTSTAATSVWSNVNYEIGATTP